MKNVTICRATAVYHKATLEDMIRDHGPVGVLDKIQGPELVARWRVENKKYRARAKRPDLAHESKLDAEWMEAYVFPAYLDTYAALSTEGQAATAIPTPEQAAVFRKIGALSSPKADAGEVILAAACYLIEMIPGDGWEHRVTDLNAMLRKFAKKRTVPENRFWVNDDQPAGAASPTKSLKDGRKREAA